MLVYNWMSKIMQYLPYYWPINEQLVLLKHMKLSYYRGIYQCQTISIEVTEAEIFGCQRRNNLRCRTIQEILVTQLDNSTSFPTRCLISSRTR